MQIKELQIKQAEYDKEHFSISHPAFEKIRHITLHLMHSVGKIADYCEGQEHQIRQEYLKRIYDVSQKQVLEEAIPDLLIHCLQLANIFNLDLEGCYLERLTNNIQRLATYK